MIVLQFFFILKVSTSTKIIQMPIVMQKHMIAYFRDVNFRTFMAAMIMQQAIMSFMIQFFFENHQAKQKPKAMAKLTMSSTLIDSCLTLISQYLRPVILLSKNNDQLAHSQTAAIPNPHDSTLTATSTTQNLNTATIPPIMMMALKKSTRGKEILQPAPPIDQALEYRATMVIIKVQKIISMRSPISKLLPQNSLLHSTQQEMTKSSEDTLSLTTSKQLKQLSRGRLQLFLTSITQGQAEHTTTLPLLICAFMELYSVDIAVVMLVLLVAVMLSWQGVFSLYWASDWMQVQRGLREQLKELENYMKELSNIGLAELLQIEMGTPRLLLFVIVMTNWESDGTISNRKVNIMKYQSRQDILAAFLFRIDECGDMRGIRVFAIVIKWYNYYQGYTSMDQRSNSSQKHHYFDVGRQQEAVVCLKNCVEYISQLFKICHCTFRAQDEHMGIGQYCQFVEKMLRKLVTLLPKTMIPLDMHNKFVKEFDQINENYQALLKDHKDYKCEINVLESQLAEAEKREQILLEEKQKQKKYTKGFDKKLSEVQRFSESKLQKQTSVVINSEDIFKTRKKSLPTIINHAHKIKPSSKHSLHLLATQQEKTQRLVEHLRRKY